MFCEGCRMGVKLDILKQRMLTRDEDGKLLPAITGEESDAELRQLVLELSTRCPLAQAHAHCPFCMLGGLSRTTLENLVFGMKRDAMTFLFDAECELRNEKLPTPPRPKEPPLGK
jgi:hypothetical protein